MKSLFIPLFCCIAFLASTRVSAQGLRNIDNTANAGKVEWGDRQAKLGQIPQGVPVTREFTVTNISKEDLKILSVHPGCHCTAADFSQEPVKPGKTTIIRLTFDAQIPGDFYKIVSVKTNFDPDNAVALVLIGKVIAK